MKNMFVSCLLVSGLLAGSSVMASAEVADMDAVYVEESDMVETDGGALEVIEDDALVYADEETGDVIVDELEDTMLIDESGNVLEEETTEDVVDVEEDFPVEE
ncbi:MAG: hypothetical protein PHP44_08105 [Kiritimatiellae bacterium]|nr:hypothetical protein [Kiritimatiellia bacterium]MDD4736053.1 hypothetical protein [Kiritimatiellia bacterium]